MGSGNLRHDRQPQTGARRRASSVIPSMESPEYCFALGARNSRAAIQNTDPAGLLDPNLHRTAGRGMGGGILDQVLQSNHQGGSIPAHNRGSLIDQFQIDATLKGKRSQRRDRLDRDPPQVCFGRNINGLTFDTCDLKHLADEPGHALAIRKQAEFLGTVRQRFEPSDQHGKRGAQTMGGVGHEAPL